jgi:hypothetical protein
MDCRRGQGGRRRRVDVDKANRQSGSQ